MGGIVFDQPITAGTVLIRDAIQSQNYASGASGWKVNADGNVEFNSGTFRVTLTASEIIGSIFGSSTTDPSIWINEGGTSNSLRVYDAAGDLVVEIGAESGSQATALFYDPAGGRAISLGQQIQWLTGSPILSQFAALYQTVKGILFNTQLTGGIGWDTLHSSWVKLVPGSDNFYTWQTTPAYSANWAASTTFNGSASWGSLQLRLDAEDNVVTTGAFKAGAVLPGSTICNFPVPYRPKAQWPIPVQRNNGGVLSYGMAEIGPSGNLNLLAANGMGVAVNNEYLISGSFPLGNIS